MKYTFCNTGNCVEFNPDDKIFPVHNKPPITSLSFYLEKVKEAKSKAVYILNEVGNDLLSSETYQDRTAKFKKVVKLKGW